MSAFWEIFFPKPQQEGWFGLPAPAQLAEAEAEFFDKIGRLYHNFKNHITKFSDKIVFECIILPIKFVI